MCLMREIVLFTPAGQRPGFTEDTVKLSLHQEAITDRQQWPSLSFWLCIHLHMTSVVPPLGCGPLLPKQGS